MAQPRTETDGAIETFPTLSGTEDTTVRPSQDATRRRGSSGRSATRKSRGASILQSLMDSAPPLGAWQAIGEDTAKGPTIPEIKNGSYSADGWSHEGQLEKRQHNPHDIHKKRAHRADSLRQAKAGRRSSAMKYEPTVPEEALHDQNQTYITKDLRDVKQNALANTASAESPVAPIGPNEEGQYPNGYRFPRKHTWKLSCAIYGQAFWKFFWTIKGFLITIYALNVVAWGAMIFFLLIPGATPAMCKSYPDCNDKRYSARQIWIENCSQILTALFCVTAFGLLPWRIRDFYYMIKYQAFGDYDALRRLAGYYRGWYRLPGSDKLPELMGPPPVPEHLKAKSLFSRNHNAQVDGEKGEIIDDEIHVLEANPAVPLPVWSMAPAPLTGIRARPTKFSAMAWMIWCYILNTLFQVGLCVVMWRYNRFQRNKGYFTALVAAFITLGCLTGIAAGIIVGKEGKVVKRVEGIPVEDYDEVESAQDYQDRIAKEEKKAKKHEKK